MGTEAPIPVKLSEIDKSKWIKLAEILLISSLHMRAAGMVTDASSHGFYPYLVRLNASLPFANTLYTIG